jgi:hypothetical protein
MHKQQGVGFHSSNHFPNLSIEFKHSKNDFSIYFINKPNMVSPLLINQQAL